MPAIDKTCTECGSTFRGTSDRMICPRCDLEFWAAANKYEYRIFWSEEYVSYIGLCTELPSLSWSSPTGENALRGIRMVVRDVLVDLKRQNCSYPEPEKREKQWQSH